MLKIALIGYGKMGRAIDAQAAGRGHEIVCRLRSDNTGTVTDQLLKAADVAIEFSRPEAAWNNIHRLLNLGIPVVSGTTGWDQDLGKAEALAKEKGVGFLHAANFSLGVQLFFALNRYLARIMAPHQQYLASVEEIHHRQKKDAPSGTAIRIAEDMIRESGRWEGWQLIEGKASEAPTSWLPIRALREDPVPGTHEVRYASAIDEISLRHQANNREGFALGALVAAEYLAGKKGVHTMNQVLGIPD